jgi:uncharacterized protein VirK/YbjX
MSKKNVVANPSMGQSQQTNVKLHRGLREQKYQAFTFLFTSLFPAHFVQVLQTQEFGNLLIRQHLPKSYATLRTFVASDPSMRHPAC